MNTSDTTTVEPSSAEARWEKSIAEIRAAGIWVDQNIEGCCRSCVREDLYERFLNTDDTFEIAWTFGGDGDAYEWDNTDTMVYQDDHSSIESILFYQRVYFPQNGSGSIIAAAFRANGFLVRWDGGDWSLIEVFPNGLGSDD